MDKNNQIKAGAVLSYVNLALSSLIPFFYTPVMLRMLGEAEYGLYSLSNSVISYLSLLSFGFGGTIVRYISMYRAKNDRKKVEETFGFFLLLYCGIAILVFLCGIGLANHADIIFKKGLTNEEISKIKILMLIMAFNSALSFPVSVFSSVIISYERYIFRKLVDMLSTIVAPMINLIMLYLGYASVGMAIVSTIIQVTMLPLNVFYCLRVIKIRPKFAMLPRGIVTEMLGFSVFIFIGSIVDMLFWSTDKVILGMLASSTAVAVYNIGCTFNGMLTNLSTSISGVLTPRVTAMVSTDSGNHKNFTDLFVKVGRIQYIVVGLVVSGFVVFGQAFIVLWAGESYTDSYWIAILTLVPLSIPLIQNTGLSIVIAQNKHQFRSVVYLIIAILNVCTTYWVVPYMGGIGAALCSGISYLVGQGIIMNMYYYKVTKLDIPLFWKNIAKMSIVPISLLAGGLALNRTGMFGSWGTFFVGVCVYSVLYMVGMYSISMNDYEKDIFRKPFISSQVKCRVFRQKVQSFFANSRL
jgi:O-antigen/teichoic acid export membrane protein